MEKNNNNINEKPRNEFIFNFIKNINDIKTKSLEFKSNNYVNSLDKNLLKEKDKKIEDLKKQCEELKKQLEIKNDLKQKEEQKDIIKNKSKNFIDNNFNTSTNFPIKNEIKKIWEELALVSILDTFIDFESEPVKIFHLVSEMIIIMDRLINDLCREIYEKVSLSLNIPTNDKKFINDIEKISRPLIKEHLNKIFIDTENKPFTDKFICLYLNSLNNNNILNCTKKDKDLIEQIIKGEEFIQMIRKIKDILLYTKFNDQQLFFKIEQDFKKRNIEKLIINNINEKKKYLIINDNNLINSPAIVILNPPVMKNGFPLNNDFKTIIMLINENNYIDKDLKTNIIDHVYKIYANSFTIIENQNNKNNNKSHDENNLNIFKDKTLTFIGERKRERNYECKEKNKMKLKLELQSTINKNDLEKEKSKRTHRDIENLEQNVNLFNNNVIFKNSAFNMQKHIYNINSTYNKQNRKYNDDINKNKNSFCNLNLNQQNQEIFYDSLLQSEYLNSPKNISDNSSIQDQQDFLLSINHDGIKKLQSFNVHNNLDINNSLYNNHNNYNNKIKNNKNNINMSNDKKRNSLNDVNSNKKYNGKILSISRKNIKQKIRKDINNHSDKNIYKNILNNDNMKNIKDFKQNNKDICSTEITLCSNNYYQYDNLYLKKYRAVKEMSKSNSKGKNINYKKLNNNKKSDDKFIFSFHNEPSRNTSANNNLYKNNNVKKNLNKSKRDIDIFKEQSNIRKKKTQMNNVNPNNINNNNINSNLNSHKFEKNNSYKNKIMNNNNIVYKNIQKQENNTHKKIYNYSPLNSNMIYIPTKNNNNINNNNKNKKDKKRNNKINNNTSNNNIRRRSKVNHHTYNNNSYNSNNISGNGRQGQRQVPLSSTTMKNNTINTGFKIKNVNINYFNIMQPNELFFNQQRSNRSKSRPNISNKSNYSSNDFKNDKNNLKKSKLNNNDNSLFTMPDLIENKKVKFTKKDRKSIITKLPEYRKHNDSCLSNDVIRTKMNLNGIKKIRITKQSIRLNNGYTIHSFDRNKSSIPKKMNFIGNFSVSNNKQISFIRIPNKTRKNNSKQKLTTIKKTKTTDRLNNNNYKNHMIISQNKRNNDYFNTQNLLTQTFSNINNIIINENNKNSNNDYLSNNMN